MASLPTLPSSPPSKPWLLTDDFADPAHAALYTCLRDLSHRGTPVDAVTVLWEAHANGSLSSLPLDARAVTELLSHGVGVDVAYQARHIVRHALLRNTTTAANAISALAAEQRLTRDTSRPAPCVSSGPPTPHDAAGTPRTTPTSHPLRPAPATHAHAAPPLPAPTASPPPPGPRHAADV